MNKEPLHRQHHLRMSSVKILLKSTELIMRHCTVAPLSAAVTLRMVTLDGFGPDELSVDVNLSESELTPSPKELLTLGALKTEVKIHESSPDSVVLVQVKVKSSPEQVGSLARLRVTERKGIYT